MLLEYTVDTVDEKIGPSAVEIRRRFAERALKTSEASTDTLTFCKEKNREQRKDHLDIDLTVHESFLQGRVSLARSEHHLVVSQGVREKLYFFCAYYLIKILRCHRYRSIGSIEMLVVLLV